MLLLNIILLITPFLVWYFTGFVLNGRVFRINKKNYIFLIASILSGFSIFLTVRKKGDIDNVLLLFVLAIACEGVYSYNISKYPKKERSVENKNWILLILMMLVLINIIRVYKHTISGIYMGEICLISYLLIIIIKYITE